MKKLGFTLAEILITLGVIGILAAITLPGLNSNVNTRKIGPTLAKAVNTLESVNHTALMEESENTLDGIDMTYDSEEECYLNRIAKYLSGEYVDNGIPYKMANSSTNASGFKTKDGLIFMTVPNYDPANCSDGDGTTSSCTAIADGSKNLGYKSPNAKLPNKKYSGKFYPVMIDINGAKNPNESGKDRFMVFVDFYGSVIPAGGQESLDYGTDKELTHCTASSSMTARCTGSIADNGWELKP